ncbi:hypothetical protein GCM10009759_14850 [Kitasatospora saccharophila]|uniref:Uncharacterized protein n=1 Tax=Kitasatospora saccharophila TaxID=407973 RepID=A0ABN2WG25_9ACTN
MPGPGAGLRCGDGGTRAVPRDADGEVTAVRALEREVFLDRPVDLLRVSTALCTGCPSRPVRPAP